MNTTMRSDEAVIAEIARIGRRRDPVEACGILLPLPWVKLDGSYQWVIELPNRSLETATFEIHGSDIEMSLRPWVAQYLADPRTMDVTIWHTHPKGLVGPSSGDMKHRPSADINMMVVTLHEDGTHTATWY